MCTGKRGLSLISVGTFAILLMTSIPATTCPNTTLVSSSYWFSFNVITSWLLPVIETTPAWACLLAKDSLLWVILATSALIKLSSTTLVIWVPSRLTPPYPLQTLRKCYEVFGVRSKYNSMNTFPTLRWPMLNSRKTRFLLFVLPILNYVT